MTVVPDALRADAAWVHAFADDVRELDWPAIAFEGSQVAAAIARADPGLEELAGELRGWAATAVAAADELESADQRVGGGLIPR